MAKHAAHAAPRSRSWSRFSIAGLVQWLAGIVFIVCLIVLGAFAFQYWYQSDSYNKLSSALSVSDASAPDQLTLADLSVDWDSLKATNPDVVAWIYVPGTSINYPVVKGSDNEEYLHKSFDGSTGFLASKGTIFVDADNSSSMTDQSMVFYGHHMRDGSMFACTDDWKDQSEFDKHRNIFVLTPSGNYWLRTFAHLNTVGSDAIVQTSFSSQEAFSSYVSDKISRSMVSASDVDASSINQMIMLSTCEYTQDNGRAVTCATVVDTTVQNDPYAKADGTKPLGLTADDVADLGSS